MNSEQYPTRRAVKALISFCLLALLIAAGVGFALWYARDKNPVVLQATDDLSLQVAATLTQKNPDFRPRTWEEAVFTKIPKRFQVAVSKLWTPKMAGYSMTEYHEGDGFSLVLKANYRTKKQEEAVLAGSPGAPTVPKLAARLNYGEGWYGPEASLEGYEVPNLGIYYKGGFSHAARDRKTVTLELLDRSGGWNVDPPVIDSAEMRNPVYKPEPPMMSTAVALPAVEKHEDVTVTLEAFVTKTVSPYRKMESGEDLFQLAAKGTFLRAKGTALDPNTGLVVLRVAEEGTTEPQWRVKEVEFRYGESHRLKFDANSQAITTGGLAYVICRHDPGMLRQPVKMSVRLVRQSNFPPDEVASIELPIPAKGRLTETHEAKVWSKNLTAQASNLSQMPFEGASNMTGRKGMMALYVNANSWNIGLGESAFTGPGLPPVKIARFQHFTHWSDSDWLYNLDVYNPKRVASMAPGFDVEKYTTMSLKLTVPRMYRHPFRFVAEPVEAE